MKSFTERYLLPCFIALVIIAGLPIPVMDVDASQLAHMSDWMAKHNEPWRLMCLNHPYLDKPHLLFWLAAASFKIFGTSSWAYKIPSVLFALGGVWGLFRLGKLLYGEATGKLAAMMMATSTMFFLFVNDCRADTLLTSSIILAVYFYQRWWTFENAKDALLAGLFGAIAMSAKGPMGIMLPLLAFGLKAIWTNDFKPLKHWHSLLFLLALLVGIVPVVYAHWVQHGNAGLRFYFWTQSFGRITGESEWKNDPAPWFFFHTIPWIVLPYTIWVLAAIFREGKAALSAIRQKQRSSFEILCFAAIIPVFVVLSFSKYKLPHYIYPIIPFLLLLTANSWQKAKDAKGFSLLNKTQSVVIQLLLWVSWFICWSLDEGNASLATWLLFGLTSLFSLAQLLKGWNNPDKAMLAAAFSMCTIFFGMNRIAYPALLKFQSGTETGIYIREQHIPTDSIYTFAIDPPYSLHFESRAIIPHIGWAGELRGKSGYVFTDPKGKELLSAEGLDTLTIYQTPDFPATLLQARFLVPSERKSMLKQRLLVKISPARP